MSSTFEHNIRYKSNDYSTLILPENIDNFNDINVSTPIDVYSRENNMTYTDLIPIARTGSVISGSGATAVTPGQPNDPIQMTASSASTSVYCKYAFEFTGITSSMLDNVYAIDISGYMESSGSTIRDEGLAIYIGESLDFSLTSGQIFTLFDYIRSAGNIYNFSISNRLIGSYRNSDGKIYFAIRNDYAYNTTCHIETFKLYFKQRTLNSDFDLTVVM